MASIEPRAARATVRERVAVHELARHRAHRRRWAVVGVLLLGLAGLGVAGIVGVVRGLALLDEARNLKTEVIAISGQATAAGLDLDAISAAALRRQLDAATAQLATLTSEVDADPLVGLLSHVPGASTQVAAGHKILSAAGVLLAASHDALGVADQYVAIRAAQAANPQGQSAMAALIQLMATTTTTMTTIQGEVMGARATLNALPAGLFGPLQDARDLMVQKTDQFAPLLASYTQVDGTLPSLFGWGGQKRYLVLAEDPAELRPTGGFIGTVGLVTFLNGRLVSRQFQDVFDFDLKNDYPFVKPPPALAGHLLGAQGWQLADANWSPDFPTAAQQALALYTNETGDRDIDGVIGLTTYAIDDLMKTTGPITVAEYGITVKPGTTTLTALQNTRTAAAPGQNRKAFLDAFAGEVMDAVLALPPHKWADVLADAETIARTRDAAIWLKDAAGEGLVDKLGLDGAVRQDPGDYVYAVDANVAPASKLDAVTARSQALDVTLDPNGQATHDLRVTWTNNIELPANAPYRALQGVGTNRLLGTYFRLLTPAGSQFLSVQGGTLARLTAPEEDGTEANRRVFGNYIAIPPGSATLVYDWTTAGTTTRDGADTVYTLTVQKEPGRLADPIAVSIDLPDDAIAVRATGGATVAGRSVSFVGVLDRDLQIVVRYDTQP